MNKHQLPPEFTKTEKKAVRTITETLAINYAEARGGRVELSLEDCDSLDVYMNGSKKPDITVDQERLVIILNNPRYSSDAQNLLGIFDSTLDARALPRAFRIDTTNAYT